MRKEIAKITKIIDQMSVCIEMDLAMDGSGECGPIILNAHRNWAVNSINSVLSETNKTIKDVKILLTEWANKELEKSNKYIFIKFSRRKKFKKEKSFLDTKYGNILLTINYCYGNSD